MRGQTKLAACLEFLGRPGAAGRLLGCLALLSLTAAHGAQVQSHGPRTASWAELRVFTDDTLSAEAGGPIGGTVYPVLFLHLSPNERLVDSQITVRIRDDNPCHSGDSTAQTDLSVDPTGSGWQVLIPPSQWSTSPGPGGTANLGAGAERVYRCPLSAWNTRTQPKGHNGNHSIKLTAPLRFAGYADGQGWGEPYEATVEPATANVQNLVIEDVKTNATEDYLLFDPDSDNTALSHPALSFTIRDAIPRQYRWIVILRPTRSADWSSALAVVDGDAQAPGTVTATWQGQDATGEPAERGPYTFDIDVCAVDGVATYNYQPDQALEVVSLKWPYLLYVPESFVDNHGSVQPGHRLDIDLVNPASGLALKARASYLLEDDAGRDGTQARVLLLDNSFAVRNAVRSGANIEVPYTDIELHTFTDDECINTGDWRAIFTAVDGHKAETRDHKGRRMIAVNDGTPAVSREVQILTSECLAREYMKTLGWQILMDPASRSPYCRGPDVICYAVGPDGNYWIALVDNKMYAKAAIDASDVKGLLQEEWMTWTRSYVTDHVDSIGTDLARQLADAVGHGRVRRFVTNACGKSTYITQSALDAGIEFLNAEVWVVADERVIAAAVKESEAALVPIMKGVLATARGVWSVLAKAFRVALEIAGRLADVWTACDFLYNWKKYGLKKGTQQFLRDLVCADLVESGAYWTDERIRKKLHGLGKGVDVKILHGTLGMAEDLVDFN